jgi:cyclopropane fatty-acyl-phospholipid synthase-like methyltransferase
MLTRLAAATVALTLFFAGAPGHGQERFSFSQPSTPESVERLLTLSGLRDDDVVIDLGAGDGLSPITAAKMNAKLRGRGVEIDAELLVKSNARAASEGVGDRVRFEHQKLRLCTRVCDS